MRTSRLKLVLDTSAFTPDQLQPRFLLGVMMNGWAHWLCDHAISFRRLLLEHNTGVVVLGGELEYHEPLRFFDADSLEVDVSVRALKSGGIVQVDGTFWTHDGKKAVTMRGVCRPVQIADMALGAIPGSLPPKVLACFQPDEIEQASPARPVGPLVEDIEKTATLITKAEHPIFIHRHQCEVADQWSYIETAGLAERGRETTCREGRKELPILNRGLGVSLRSYWIELSRPMFVYDTGSIATSVYQYGETKELVFIHRINSPSAGGRPHAVIVERLRQ